MTDTTIAGLARAGGVGVETVRYYQRRGLMPKPDGAGGVRRALCAAVVKMLADASPRARIGAAAARNASGSVWRMTRSMESGAKSVLGF